MASGCVSVTLDVDDSYYYEMLSDLVGESITSEYQLLNVLRESFPYPLFAGACIGNVTDEILCLLLRTYNGRNLRFDIGPNHMNARAFRKICRHKYNLRLR